MLLFTLVRACPEFCVRHNMTERSIYAKQNEAKERGDCRT